MWKNFFFFLVSLKELISHILNSHRAKFEAPAFATHAVPLSYALHGHQGEVTTKHAGSRTRSVVSYVPRGYRPRFATGSVKKRAKEVRCKDINTISADLLRNSEVPVRILVRRLLSRTFLLAFQPWRISRKPVLPSNPRLRMEINFSKALCKMTSPCDSQNMDDSPTCLRLCRNLPPTV